MNLCIATDVIKKYQFYKNYAVVFNTLLSHVSMHINLYFDQIKLLFICSAHVLEKLKTFALIRFAMQELLFCIVL